VRCPDYFFKPQRTGIDAPFCKTPHSHSIKHVPHGTGQNSLAQSPIYRANDQGDIQASMLTRHNFTGGCTRYVTKMRILQKPSSGVLASLMASTYQPHTPRPFARCGLAGRAFSASFRFPPMPFHVCGIDSGFGNCKGFAIVLNTISRMLWLDIAPDMSLLT
jgi:hypothetical protein